MMQQSVYDREGFFDLYQKLRNNPNSLNEVVEKPTMLGLLPDLTGKRVLDLGCGCGEHLSLYLQRGADFVAGIDLSSAMLAQARKNLSHFAPRFALQQLAMENLAELEWKDFDIVTSSFAFHYVQNFPALLENIRAKLKPNGLLIFSQEHPIVTAHREGERWQKDATKQQIAYRLNFYRDEGKRERNWFKQPFNTYHRTLSTIINDLIATGFQIKQLVEPMLAEQPQWQTEFNDLQHRPVLLFVKAKIS